MNNAANASLKDIDAIIALNNSHSNHKGSQSGPLSVDDSRGGGHPRGQVDQVDAGVHEFDD